MNRFCIFAGEYYDEESGHYYLRARYYDPVTARFISRDTYMGTLDNPLSHNPYMYCYNNPLIYIDPTGHMADVFIQGFNQVAPQIPEYFEATVVAVTTVAVIMKDVPWDGVGPNVQNGKDLGIFNANNDEAQNTDENEGNGLPDLPKPENHEDLLDEGWEDVTHPNNDSGNRDYYNPETGQKVRFDKGKEGASGHQGQDHYHVHNPNSTGNHDLYLDKSGNPVPKGCNPSHVYP